MDRLTRPAGWPCGCHGWGWRAHPGFTPAHDGGTTVGDLVPAGTLPALPDDEYGTPTLPLGETRQ